MTSWVPTIDRRGGPLYLQIADALANDVAGGALEPGVRLPTHRELARVLRVTIGTITRAYAEAARRGLLESTVGRGSFVLPERKAGDVLRTSRSGARTRPPAAAAGMTAAPREDEAAGVIDLSTNLPLLGVAEERVAAALRDVLADGGLAALLQYADQAGSLRHREAGARWLARLRVPATADEVVVTSGAQHGMLLACAAVAAPGDLILAEELTFPGMRALAAFLGLRLEAVALDEQGVRDDAFRAACKRFAPKALYLMPTVQNPTGRRMPAARREAIVGIAREHGVALIEDDVHAHLVEAPPPPLAALAPERTYAIVSLSKSLAPGLRLGYLKAPPRAVPRLLTGILTTARMASPLAAEVAARLIEDGGLDAIVRDQRAQIAERQALARAILLERGFAIPASCSRESPHLFLELPTPWRPEAFSAAARERGVLVASPEPFQVGRGAPPAAVRVSLCAPRGTAALERGLRILADLLAAPAVAASAAL